MIARERERDPAAAAAEYDAGFREDVATFLSAELIAEAVESGCHERPPVEGTRYVAGVDPSGGGPDAFTLAIAHAERRGTDPARLVLDCCRGWRTPNVESVVAEQAAILARYGVSEVIGDRYSAEWSVSAFRRHGITYKHATRNRSETYLELHPLIATGRTVLLDVPVLVKELRQLERRTGRGKDVVDHPPRVAHDDHANCVAIAIVEAEERARRRPFNADAVVCFA